MKKLISTLMILSACSLVFAQQGSWYIGGMAGFNTRKSENSGSDFKTTNWNFSPEIGTWSSDNLQIGLSLNLSGYSNDNDYKSSVFSPSIYVRKWKSVGEVFSIYGGINLGFSTEKEKFGSNSSETISSGFQSFLDFGAALNLSERFGIIGRYAVLGYASMKDQDSGEKTSAFGLDVNTLGNPFNVGIYYTFKQ